MKGIKLARKNGKTEGLLRAMLLEKGLHPRDIDSVIAWRRKYLNPSKTPPQFNRKNPVLVDMEVNERYLYIFPNGYAISLIWRNGVYNSPEAALMFWDEENLHFELSNMMMDLYDWNDTVHLVDTRKELINILKRASSLDSGITLGKSYIDFLRDYVKYKPVATVPKYWLYEYLKDKGLDPDGEYPNRVKPGAVEYFKPSDDLINDFSPEFKKFQQNMATIDTLNKIVTKDRERIIEGMENSPLSGLANVMRKATEAFSGLASSIRESYNDKR